MKYDGILIALYLLTVVVIVFKLFSMTALTVALMLLIVMIVVQKIGLEKMIKATDEERNKKLEEILYKVEDVSRRVDNFKDDVNRQVVFVDNKVADVRAFAESEATRIYADISRKVAELEDRISEFRQSFSAAVGSIDERIQGVEKDENEESADNSSY